METLKHSVCVIIPCHNESAAIEVLLKEFGKDKPLHRRWNVDVVIVDNNSTDDTAAVASRHGAFVLTESRTGKGYAIMAGLRNVSDHHDFVVMMDGDNTYRPKELKRMLEPLESNFCDAVLGSRMQGKVAAGAMSFPSRVGNWFFSFLVRTIYRANITDVLTGYFAWKKSAIDKMLPHLESGGFEIEMEMITKMSKLGIQAYSVPISYHGRIGESKLNHLADGYVIFRTFIRNLTWQPKEIE